jgi:hypothetical protein
MRESESVAYFAYGRVFHLSGYCPEKLQNRCLRIYVT